MALVWLWYGFGMLLVSFGGCLVLFGLGVVWVWFGPGVGMVLVLWRCCFCSVLV